MASLREGQGPALVPGRDCGTCSLCCILPDIAEFDKPANEPCRHCLVGGGCNTYEVRPSTCRDFFCLWRTDATLGAHWQPQVAGMMVYEQGAQVTVLVDPASGEKWREEPYLGELRSWAGNDTYVVVYVCDSVSVIRGAPKSGHQSKSGDWRR